MNRLIKFEFIRIKKTKVLYLFWILCILIAVMGMALNEFFYGDGDNPLRKMLSVFNAYSQFSYLILGFMIVTTYTKDRTGGISSFYKQIGFSFSIQYLSKTIVLFLCSVPLINVVTVICNFIYKNKDMRFLVVMLVSITISLLYIILLAIFVSLIMKKSIQSVLLFYGLFVLFNIINIGCYGLINPADGNSIVTYCLANWNEVLLSHYSLDKVSEDVLKYKEAACCLVPLFWCLVLAGIDVIIIKVKERNW